MLQRLSGTRGSRVIQITYEILAVLLAVAWFALIGFILLQGAYEVGGLFIVFTILIAGLAYANERPD
ncbi:hypothetical protein ACFQGE_10870 [Halomicroarcula sp. GCM10025817]|uniref:hypothetical protein n=1 Tax=Haloarcula TaxID=2237 RepID=UPI0023E7D107|nr:hypothetical protein [Halomicroarcula sp. SYNS111]